MLYYTKKLIYLGGVYSIGATLEKSLAFFFIPIYTAYLGTYDYGIVGLMSITVALISKFVSTPINNGFVRYYNSPEFINRKGLLLFNCFCLTALQVTVLAVVFYLSKSLISRVVLGNQNLVNIIEVYAFILFFQTLSGFLLTFLRQEEKARAYIFISWARFFITAGFILFGLIYLKIGVLALIYGSLIGSVVNVVCVLPIFFSFAVPKISVSVVKKPLQYGYPLILQGFSILLIQSGDRFVLKLFSTVSVVGVYSFGYKFAEIMGIMLVTPLKRAIQPVIFKQEGDPDNLRAFTRSKCTLFYFVGMFLCLLLSLFSREIIQLMAHKKEFWGGHTIVPIIAFCYLQEGLGRFFGIGLTMSKKSYHISANVLITSVVNIGLNFVFIPIWGMIGAAFATLISYIIWNALRLYYSAKFYDLHFELDRLLYITALGTGLYILSLFIANTEFLLANIFIKAAVLVTYPLLIIKMGLLHKREMDLLKQLWNTLKTVGIKDSYERIMRSQDR